MASGGVPASYVTFEKIKEFSLLYGKSLNPQNFKNQRGDAFYIFSNFHKPFFKYFE